MATALALALTTAGPARAGPVSGTGSASIAAPGARTEALAAARRVALVAALSLITEPMVDAQVERVLGESSAWTSNYRVVEQRTIGDQIEITVEVQVDVARLMRRVVDEPPRTSTRVRLGRATSDEGCPASIADPESLRVGVAELGLALGGEGEPVDVTMTCRALGPVPVSHLVAHAVAITVHGDAGIVASVEEVGFGADDAAAAVDARQLAMGRLAPRIRSFARGEIRVTIRNALSAGRVRRVEEAFRGVLGVRSAALERVTRDIVDVAVRSDVGAERLAGRLSSVSFPDFVLSDVMVTAPDAIELEIR